MTKLVVVAAAVLGFGITTRGEDWPQWGGPARDHASKEKGLLQKWPASGPKRVWVSKEGGIGYAGISVVGDRIYTMGARGDSEYVIALDAKDGKEAWATDMART